MELTYPHEVIEISKHIGNIIENSDKYKKDVEVLASFFNKKDIKIEDNDDPIIPLIANYKNKKRQKYLISLYQKTLNRYTEETLRLRTNKALAALDSFIRDSILVYFLIDELQTKIDYSKIEEISKKFHKNYSYIDIFLKLKKTYSDRDSPNSVGEVGVLLDKLNSLDPENFIDSILITFKFGNSIYKSEFMTKHYLYLREFYDNNIKDSDLMKNYWDAISGQKMPIIAEDSILIFLKLAICLYACGYEKTLRLPLQEQINYIKYTMGEKTIDDLIEENYSKINKLYLTLLKTEVTIKQAFILSIAATSVVSAGFVYLIFKNLFLSAPVEYIPTAISALIGVFILINSIYKKISNMKSEISSILKKK